MKSAQIFPRSASARKATPVKKKKPKRISGPKDSWVAVGIDLSTSSIAGCAFGYDYMLRKKERGPVFNSVRWERHQDYFHRLNELSRGHIFILDLIGQLKMLVEPDRVNIAIEEPWPFGMQKRLESNSLKQQAQMSGCFIGGLIRWGYVHIYEIHNQWWRGIIAEDLGISTHWTKYGKGIEGKMRSKEWALDFMKAPEWPDLIQHSKRGLIPRPEGSRAKAQQPDDRYDALAMAVWMKRELEKSGA
jgi:hypothetical protein